jgi:hypothetical protein
MMKDNDEESQPELIGVMTLIFGFESKITEEEYFNEMEQKKLNWVFTPKLIRDRA